jgi:hypothetical protein
VTAKASMASTVTTAISLIRIVPPPVVVGRN